MYYFKTLFYISFSTNMVLLSDTMLCKRGISCSVKTGRHCPVGGKEKINVNRKAWKTTVYGSPGAVIRSNMIGGKYMNETKSGHEIKKDARTAILLVASSTTRDGAKKILENCVDAFKNAYPNSVVRYAIASELVRQVMAKEGNIVSSPVGALAKLIDEGFTKMIVQPLYITPGDGLHVLYSTVSTFNEFSGKHVSFGIDGILIGKPLLMNTEDYWSAADAITAYFGMPAENEATVLVSPIDEGGADPSLCQLQLMMDEKTGGRIVIGTSCGYPGADWVLQRLKHINARKVTLAPLTLIPGKHTDYELDGSGPDSWKNKLEAAGYTVSVSSKILGESPQIAALFIQSVADTGKSHGFL
jgi:sirohydrochlorin cobaltochelatase